MKQISLSNSFWFKSYDKKSEQMSFFSIIFKMIWALLSCNYLRTIKITSIILCKHIKLIIGIGDQKLLTRYKMWCLQYLYPFFIHFKWKWEIWTIYVYIEATKICHFTNGPLVLSFDCLLVPNMVCIIYLSAIVVYVVVSFLHVLVWEFFVCIWHICYLYLRFIVMLLLCGTQN